jgi:glycosyltransferase involved in cell wall biosynthesis
MDQKQPINILIITNIPSPYRVLQFNKLAEALDKRLCVIYYQKKVNSHHWNTPILAHKSIFLKRTLLSRINFHPDLLKYLKTENPQIIIASGFSPTIIFSFIYAKLKKKKFILFTDAWIHSVNNLNICRRLIRKIIIPSADASICVGKKGKEFLEKYGAKKNTVFISPLSIDNDYYKKYYVPVNCKRFDLIFSGQFIPRKMPFFLLEVLKELKNSITNISIIILGSGPLEQEILLKLKEFDILYSYPGFIKQEELPKYYANAKILLFPTRDDPWGIVTNEACAVGTPVITCLNAGAANDLVIHDFNGFVLPLSVDVWVEHIIKLLSDYQLYEFFSKNSFDHVQCYSIKNAADGINEAINYLQANEKN